MDNEAQTQDLNVRPPAVGDRIDRYTIDGLIGRGSMGVVYHALDTTLGRPVALKFLDPGHVAAPEVAALVRAEMKQRFAREARTVALLSHPNAVQILAAELTCETPYLVMEYLQGEPLSLLLQHRNRLSVPESACLGMQLADVLGYAWKKHRMIHRDLKPANIMMIADGRCKLMDFGLAKITGAVTSRSAITKSGITMGSDFYKSPEQHRGDKRLDFRSDVYSLGVILYQTLVGTVPFAGRDEIDVYDQKCAGLSRAPAAVTGDIPQDLSDLVVWMLSPEAVARPESYDVVYERLAEWSGTSAGSSEGIDRTLPGTESRMDLARTTFTRRNEPTGPDRRTNLQSDANGRADGDLRGHASGPVFLPRLRDVINRVRPGHLFGRYRVDEMIGCGGMGVVFSGHDTVDGDAVAIKFLASEPSAQDSSPVSILESSTATIHKLAHHSIVKVREFCHIDALDFLVMDLFLGPEGRPVNLKDYASSFGDGNGLLDETDACQIMLALLDAVAYAHRHGVIHCDLKPENILLQFKGFGDEEHWDADLKITDFGIAKLLGEGLILESVTRSLASFQGHDRAMPPDAAALIGTFDFMSPEQRRGEPATCQSDLFAIGMMIFRLLTGNKQLGLRTRPSQLRPCLNPAWDDFLLHALREKPEQRFADASGMAAEIKQIQDRLG